MTKQRKLKKQIRVRMEKTGESYAAAKSNTVKTKRERATHSLKLCSKEECVLPEGHLSDEHGDDHQAPDGTWWNVGKSTSTDSKPRTPGCLCHLEEGDSPCPVHGEEDLPTATELLEVGAQGGTTAISGPTPLALETVTVKGFDQPVPKELAVALELKRANARAEIRDEASALSENLKKNRLELDAELGFIQTDILPCGHTLQKRLEIIDDIKAVWGQPGVDALKALHQEQRRKHEAGLCSEAIKELKVTPRYDIQKKQVTLVATDESGKMWYPTSGNYEVPQDFYPANDTTIQHKDGIDSLESLANYSTGNDRELINVIINGVIEFIPTLATYEDVIVAARYDRNRILSVTYKAKDGRSGILSPGKQVEVSSSMIFSVADTSNA